MKSGQRSVLLVALWCALFPTGVAHAQWEDEEPVKKKPDEKKKPPPAPPKKVEPVAEEPPAKKPPESEEPPARAKKPPPESEEPPAKKQPEPEEPPVRAKKPPPEPEEPPARAKKPPPEPEEAPRARKAPPTESADEEETPSRKKVLIQKDEERARESEATPEESDRPTRRAAREAEPAEEGDPSASQRAVSASLGGLISAFGGLAFPRIALKGVADNGFYAHGLGGVLDLAYDFPSMDLDWRVHVMGAYPAGLLALGGTVGIRKLLGPWTNPVVVARGGAGLELMIGGGKQVVDPAAKDPATAPVTTTVMLIPVFLGVGESGIEYAVSPKLSVGAFFLMAVRYGVPLGFGFDIGGVGRVRYAF